MRSLLLLLADGRLPAGGHAHSGSLEQAAAQGLVRDEADLVLFLRGRLRTTGRVAGGLAAVASRADGAKELSRVDRMADARTPSPAQRAASRSQGRGLLRAAAALLPQVPPLPRSPHHAVALGAVAAAAGADPLVAATLALQHSITGPATAAVRLLSFDPLGVQRILAGLAAEVDEIAAATALCEAPSAATTPLADLLAETHETREVRLFAS
jgi:urease accessory protein